MKEKEELSVGYLTASDPLDKRSWSGIHHSMYQTLSNEFKVVHILGPIHKNFFIKGFNLFVHLVHLIAKKRYNQWHNILSSRYFALRLKQKLKQKKLDVLFAASGSVEIAYLKTNIPICYLADTSYGQIENYYEEFSRMSRLSSLEGNLIEKRAIDNSTTQVYSSKWASEYVAQNYVSKKDNIFTVSFGANINHVPKINTNKDFDGKIHLLFLGVDWERKGGDIVFNTFLMLDKAGYNLQLTICGCTPPKKITHPKVKIIPFLNKNNKEDNDVFLQLMNQAHILFVPTQADCTPIVFCEANANGIPVITTNTGGVNSIIEDGLNGITLPLESGAEEYFLILNQLLGDRNRLKKMANNSRIEYEKRLNWEVWGKKIREIILYTAKNEQHES